MDQPERRKLEPHQIKFHTPKAKVSSIYDRFSFKEYSNIPISFLFKFDIGLVHWLIENYDGFCIKEYDFLSNFSTVNEKVFEMSHIRNETMKNYREYAQMMSNEEILAAFGSTKYYINSDVAYENDRKLKLHGITKTAPKLMDRTYLCFHRSSFPVLSGKWIYESVERSDKNTADIIFLKCSDQNLQAGKDFINNRVAIFNFNRLYTFNDSFGREINDTRTIKPGSVFQVTTNPGDEPKYQLKKMV